MADSNSSLSERIADTLETVATRIRETTVDRLATVITSTSIGVIAVVAGFMAIFWLLVGIFRILGTLMGTETAYAVVGLIFILVGAILWSKRYPQDTTQDTTSQQE